MTRTRVLLSLAIVIFAVPILASVHVRVFSIYRIVRPTIPAGWRS